MSALFFGREQFLDFGQGLVLSPPRQAAFPDAQHPPALPAQGLIDQQVPRPVGRQLGLPEQAIVFGFGGMAGTAMPETAIHKHRQPRPAKDKIRFAKDFLTPPPARHPVPPQQHDERQFRVPIPVRTDAGHDRRAFFPREDVRHPSVVKHRKSESQH